MCYLGNQNEAKVEQNGVGEGIKVDGPLVFMGVFENCFPSAVRPTKWGVLCPTGISLVDSLGQIAGMDYQTRSRDV